MTYINPNTQKWFFGRISRDEAEKHLEDQNLLQGLYLLRESMTNSGSYALSICHQGRIHHYSIERQPDGKVMIQDGRRFPGPVELVEHHKRNLDGFLTKPAIPCERPNGMSAMAWPHVSMVELEVMLLNKAEQMKLQGSQLEAALGPDRQALIKKVALNLHKDQKWFFGRITRANADQIMQENGHRDGKFLVREREDHSGTFALSLSYGAVTKHYKIGRCRSTREGDKLAIEDGPRFDNLMDLVAHYHNKTDGLLCKLSEALIRNGWRKQKLAAEKSLMVSSAYGPLPQATNTCEAELPTPSASFRRSAGYEMTQIKTRPLPETPAQETEKEAVKKNRSSSKYKRILHAANDPQSMVNAQIMNSQDVDVEPSDEPSHEGAARGLPSAYGSDDPQAIYDTMPDCDEVFNVKRKELQLQEEIGNGNFGSVLRGIYQKRVPVAVKTLKQDNIPNVESEIMREAKLMAGLRHRNIVRLIGVCKADSILMVLELAECGQLNKYLKKRGCVKLGVLLSHAFFNSQAHLPPKQVIELMFQVSEGMKYLESKNFVHRDLAARNVLLVSDRHAKISDFGMSKALGLGNAYYKAEAAGKWPLKWYAPECIYYFRFDSKSDVWSYGVTMWEALSYGQRPYKGLKGQEILEMIEHGGRLDCPTYCPPGVYELMLRCWEYEKEARPSFQDIVDHLRKYK